MENLKAIFRDFYFWMTIKRFLNFFIEWARVGQSALLHYSLEKVVHNKLL